MKVLFVSSGRNGNVSVIVKNQGESLEAEGIEIDYFIVKPGLAGYLSSVPKIRRIFKKGNYDLAHAHYSLSGFIAALAGCKPLVVSLMGSDVFQSLFIRILVQFFHYLKWDRTIVKTNQMKTRLKIDKAFTIPNGVDLSIFRPISKQDARKYLNCPEHTSIILFISVLNRPEKNLELARAAIKALQNNDIELRHVYDVPNKEIPYHLNSADALLLTSKWEGSVNVIKEAMACNIPVVATNVGDIEWIIGDTEGCYITSDDPNDIAEKIKAALAYGGRTKGRNRIIKLGLDSNTISGKIISVYKDMIHY